jgi:hypothetical protein
VTKYGTGASLRGFSGGGLASLSRPAGVSNVHWSWKPTLGQAVTDSQIKAATANLRAGDIVELWHESDVKYRTEAKTYGTAEAQRRLTQRLTLKNQFHDSVVRLRRAGAIPRVRTCNTWAGWSVDSTSSVNPMTPSLHCRADLLGIDMDGIPASDTFYPYAERQMGAKFVKAMTDGNYTGWTIPEFCMPAVPSDPTHQRRITWFRDQVAKIKLGVKANNIAPPVAINWFDYPGIIGPEEMLTKANEITAWSTLVATGRTT